MNEINTPEGKTARINISKKWTKQVVKWIPRLQLNCNNWIVQNEGGGIFVCFGDCTLKKFKPDYLWEWIPINSPIGSIYICNPIKGKTIKTFRQAKAQLIIDHWWIDSRGRLIVQGRNVPDSLKAQA